MSASVPCPLPHTLTRYLNPVPEVDVIREAADIIAGAIEAMHGTPCHVRIGDDFSFVLVIRKFLEGAS